VRYYFYLYYYPNRPNRPITFHNHPLYLDKNIMPQIHQPSHNCPGHTLNHPKAKETVTLERLLHWTYALQLAHRGPAWQPSTGFGAALDMSQLGIRVDTNPGGGAKVSNVHRDAEAVDAVVERLCSAKQRMMLVQFGLTGCAPDAHLSPRCRFVPRRGWQAGSDPREAIPEYDPVSKRPVYTAVMVLDAPADLPVMRKSYELFHAAMLLVSDYLAENSHLLTRFDVRREKDRRLPWNRG
tara:strand:- start:18772 stop:19488 length:717 start_codon:yes stop_codon:yes gene_type:complete